VRGRRYVLLVLVLLLSLLLLTVQTRTGGAGRAGELVAFVTTPVQSVFVMITRGAFGMWNRYVEWKSLTADNALLRLEAERLRVEALRARESEQENARLRRLLTLRERLPLSTLGGEIIGREAGGWVRSLTVNRGHSSGVVQQMPVIVPQGLVGRVVQVRSRASVVQLLTDPTSAVGAMAQRTRTQGLVEGDAGGALRFKFMARDGAGVAPGDLVITSGLGNLFPKGLPIGRVARIEDKGSALFHFAVLAPVVDFARVEEVLLLTEQTTHDVASLFQEGG